MSISKERKTQLNEFQKKYNLKFKDLELLNQAFIHTSYTNENGIDEKFSYEKLEFYGDAVLKLSISDFLYNHFIDYNEGELTKLRAELVSDKNIFEYAKILGFEKLIILGRNEKKQGGAKKESILACAFEALLGAIFINYKDKGYKKAKEFLEENFIDDILTINKKIKYLNPKAILQEYTQGINHQLPEYILVDEIGKAHNKEFFIEVKFNNEIIGKGSAKSIKKAQSEAAFNALKKLNLIEE
ncbi:MAG: ribonuclease III [Candidatus Gastranaerophilales bacterium]|nr:ribonuclease III [Candidatus Gastranaerophilales bacterium]